jgi:ribonuclease VapC
VIVIDTSVLVALRQREPEEMKFRDRIAKEHRRFVPAASCVEFVLLRRLGARRRDWLRDFLREVRAEIAPIDASVAEIAIEAADRYGRGSRHKAQLNFGDCLSYAVAKHLDAPLLYKGGDFIHTDIESALSL